VNAVNSGSAVIASFSVADASSGAHNGLALDGVTPQQYLDVQLDPADPMRSIANALMTLLIAEYGGIEALLAACISQRVPFKFLS
jgi:hypothetical protein